MSHSLVVVPGLQIMAANFDSDLVFLKLNRKFHCSAAKVYV